MSRRRKFLFENVLLPDNWANDVIAEVSEDGNFLAISAKGEGGPDSGGPDYRRISGWVIPGIPNCHSHAHQRALAGLGEKAGLNENGDGKAVDSFWTWRAAMYRCLERIQPHHLYAICRQLYLEMLKAGYTSVGEFQYLHHDPDGDAYSNRAEMTLQCLQAASDSGIGFTALPVLYRFGGFGEQPFLEGQKRFINNADEFCRIVESIRATIKESRSPTNTVGIAPHSLRAVSESLLNSVISNLGQDRIPVIHLHMAERTEEVRDCRSWSGETPVQWLFNRFQPDERWCLIHATHMTDSETGNMAESGAVAGLCPTTEANLGDGFFNMNKFAQCKGSWTIGSDSHVSISPVEEMRWLEYGLRLQGKNRNVLSDAETQNTGMALLKGVLKGGRMSSGRKIGRIEHGCRADFLVLDPDHPRLAGRSGDNLIDSWIFSGNENPINDVYVGGERVIENGHHIMEETAAEEFKRILTELSDL